MWLAIQKLFLQLGLRDTACDTATIAKRDVAGLFAHHDNLRITDFRYAQGATVTQTQLGGYATVATGGQNACCLGYASVAYQHRAIV